MNQRGTLMWDHTTPEMHRQMKAARGLFRAFDALRLAIQRADWRRERS